MLFAELNKNELKVIKGIHRVVAERGADWRYPNGRIDGAQAEKDFVFDPDWSEEGSCYNLLPDGSAACIIGSLAVDQGLPTYRSGSAGADAHRWGVSTRIEMAMRAAQNLQDAGYTWGVALDAFDMEMSNSFFDYAEGLAKLMTED